jgi:threonine dehydratase
MQHPVRPITLSDILAARDRIRGRILRTPLIPLELGPGFPDIRLKLENLQPTNSYKFRGATNAVAVLPPAERQKGIWTISTGNAGQGIAHAARGAGIPCTVVVPDGTPAIKTERIRALDARLLEVPLPTAVQALEDRAFPGLDGAFIHPFDEDAMIAGHASMALEILEDAPDTATILASFGGGGLAVAIGSAVRATAPRVRVLGVEPETAAPGALSFQRGSPQAFPGYRASFVSGAGSPKVFPRMWQRMQGVVDGCLVVSLEQTRAAMRLMAEKARIVSEGAAALALAGALSGQAGSGPIVAIVSGGNIDLKTFGELVLS